MISLIAGSHADEPVGPLNLYCLLRSIQEFNLQAQFHYLGLSYPEDDSKQLTISRTLESLLTEVERQLGLNFIEVDGFIQEQMIAWRDLWLELEIPKTQEVFICPHLNPLGAQNNLIWWKSYLKMQIQPVDGAASLKPLFHYLTHRVRELPGDDIEFGYPRPEDSHQRPDDCRREPWAVFKEWQTLQSSEVQFHLSLHGMGYSAGPWFLVEHSWDQESRLDTFKAHLTDEVIAAKYHLHDMERQGDKGFWRLGPGFCSRPDSQSMKEHFLAQGDQDMANKFRPSSMEAYLTLFPKAFTAVSEMPLFTLPDVGKHLGPPDLKSEYFKVKISQWKLELSMTSELDFDQECKQWTSEAWKEGIRMMPLADQLKFQRSLFRESYGLFL